MLVLPKAGQGRSTARQEMLREIDDPLTFVLIARGDDAMTRAFVQRAETVAKVRRRVVHVRDPGLLDPAEITRWFADDRGEAVIGAVLADRTGRCGRVLRKRQSRVNIDLAFLACERGGS